MKNAREKCERGKDRWLKYCTVDDKKRRGWWKMRGKSAKEEKIDD